VKEKLTICVSYQARPWQKQCWP